MSDNQTVHIAVREEDDTRNTTNIYAIDADVWREMDPSMKKTPHDWEEWIKSKGGKLDCSDGPAVTRCVGRLILEEYYSKGRKHREDGPAVVRREDGVVTQEQY